MLMKFLRVVSCLLVLAILAGCGDAGATGPGEAESAASQASIEAVFPDDTQPGPPTEPDEPEAAQPYAHSTVVEVDLTAGIITAELSYAKDDRLGNVFLLNRDFAVTALVCDGEAIDPGTVMEGSSIEGRYPVSRYPLPHFDDSLLIRYTGSLTGSPRLTTYSRETISEDFTLLRWETFCYPLFGEEIFDLYDFLDLEPPLRAEITLRTPVGYTVATPFPLLGQDAQDGTVAWRFEGDLANLAAAIAEYAVLELPSGEYYFLPGADLEGMEALISPVMAEAEQFLSDTYGEAEIPGGMRYITMPEGLGGWAIKGKAVFLPQDSFASEYDTLQLVHEYIHLGWNAKTETANRSVARARFFDEGFTCYFQSRVAGHLWGDEAYLAEIASCSERLKTQAGARQVPIAAYGEHDYGMLSYNIGPIFLHELASLVGTAALDAATRTFLERYRDTPVDFDLFAATYTELLGADVMEGFLEDWLYSTAGIERVLATS